jgi:hypothetical protein
MPGASLRASPPLLHRAAWAQISSGLSPLLDEARGSVQLGLRALEPYPFAFLVSIEEFYTRLD